MGRGNRGAQVVALIAVLAAGWAPVATATPPPQPWVQVAVTTYPLATGVFLTKGIASDGAKLFFSYKFGVLRAGLDGTLDTPPKPTGIPPAIAALGGDHMGDIDVHGGFIYAPIEDGAAGYHHPFIARYDAATMAYTGTSWELDHTLLTDGVPWVAVDGPRHRLYTARWDDPQVLNVHDLDDPTSVTTVPLQLPPGTDVSRIQGAKMLDGLLYAARDNGDAKSIVAIDPVTGTITPVMDRNLGAATEAEGIAFVPTADGVLMCTTEIGPLLTVRLRAYRPADATATGDPSACLPRPVTAGPDPLPTPTPDPAPVPGPVPTPAPTPKPNPLAVATPSLLRHAKVQRAPGAAGGRFTTLTKRVTVGRRTYRVRITSGTLVLATGTVKARRLTLTVRRATSAAGRRRVVALVTGRLRDLRSVTIRRT